jgi:dephospho-CoA kinase
MPYVVGLTGGIGSGKSEVGAIFAELGAEVVDTDAIAHELTSRGGAAMAAIRDAFGPSMVAPDGALDRGAMRALVFSDASARTRLESILHPMIREESARRAAASRAPYVILAVPLLIESGTYRARCDRVLVVDCAESTQLARVMMRSKVSEETVRAIVAAQASREQRLSAADDVIDNDGEIAALRPRVEALHRRYLAAAAHP